MPRTRNLGAGGGAKTMPRHQRREHVSWGNAVVDGDVRNWGPSAPPRKRQAAGPWGLGGTAGASLCTVWCGSSPRTGPPPGSTQGPEDRGTCAAARFWRRRPVSTAGDRGSREAGAQNRIP